MLWIYFRIFGIQLRRLKVFFIRLFLLEKKSRTPVIEPSGGVTDAHWTTPTNYVLQR
jgi:hypothetical protein